MRMEQLDYDLPPERIATTAAEPRDSARLMVIHRDTGRVEHRVVRDLPELGVLRPDDLMIANFTRVLRARFEGTRRQTGGRVRGLMLSHEGRTWQLMLESRGKPRVGEHIDLTDRSSLTLTRKAGRGQWSAELHGPVDTLDLLEVIGHTPLPPYIRAERRRRGMDEENEQDWLRYNTTFGSFPGSVAAPTAGLHFTPELIERLELRKEAVVLNVGLGTFEPVRTDVLEDHDIHEELLMVPAQTIAAIHEARQRDGRILAVGTTTVRAIESLPDPLPQPPDIAMHADRTRLFITPDRVADGSFRWRFTDMLLTNFHLPRSTLLAMVAALPGVGIERLLGWYDLAIREDYRFYSYGDAMLLA